ncbi:hypothetical protein EV690_1321 [Celerinatantimonas diazotrophica]|uniref:Uncharacterized protein n=2 Tax=Celerinatantimonas diazotrophica TaxID=412034 RepID=A0A4R1K1U2_9GAMM|nr:hypothetical protein EV690_1321 [Celerinatantimonas diazotrophica]CAG9298305.1 hypothetical protein CEDIAZO_03505 [Celerinatantimonas diazotrophica]
MQAAQQVLQPIQQAANAPDDRALKQNIAQIIAEATAPMPSVRLTGALPQDGQNGADPGRAQVARSTPKESQPRDYQPRLVPALNHDEQLQDIPQQPIADNTMAQQSRRSAMLMQSQQQVQPKPEPAVTQARGTGQGTQAHDHTQPRDVSKGDGNEPHRQVQTNRRIAQAAIQAQSQARESIFSVNQAVDLSSRSLQRQLMLAAMASSPENSEQSDRSPPSRQIEQQV